VTLEPAPADKSSSIEIDWKSLKSKRRFLIKGSFWEI
jgi:hypothetical protein